MIDRPTPEALAVIAARLREIENAGGHLHTWPGGLDILAECATCGETIDQFGTELPRDEGNPRPLSSPPG